jgi:hypothetical protein
MHISVNKQLLNFRNSSGLFLCFAREEDKRHFLISGVSAVKLLPASYGLSRLALYKVSLLKEEVIWFCIYEGS